MSAAYYVTTSEETKRVVILCSVSNCALPRTIHISKGPQNNFH